MRVSVCEKCPEYKRKTWTTTYTPANYHKIGVTHAYAYCMFYEKRCSEVRRCEFNYDLQKESKRKNK